MDKSGERGAEDLVNDTNDLWKRCADALREQVSDATWRTWLTGLVPQAFDGDLLVLTAPSTLVRDRIENRFMGLIAAAVSLATSRGLASRCRRSITMGPRVLAKASGALVGTAWPRAFAAARGAFGLWGRSGPPQARPRRPSG